MGERLKGLGKGRRRKDRSEDDVGVLVGGGGLEEGEEELMLPVDSSGLAKIAAEVSATALRCFETRRTRGVTTHA